MTNICAANRGASAPRVECATAILGGEIDLELYAPPEQKAIKAFNSTHNSPAAFAAGAMFYSFI